MDRAEVRGKLIKALRLSDGDYNLLRKAFEIPDGAEVTSFSPLTLKVYKNWTTQDVFDKYLRSHGINTSRGKFLEKNSSVYYQEGRVRLSAEGIPF